MKTAFLMNETGRKNVFNSKAMEYFKSLGEVCVNTGGTDAESVSKTIKDADIAVTSWGNTAIDGKILENAPHLRLLAHAAGSVKPVVSDELWKKGIRVLSAACPLGEGVAETALGFTLSACKNFYSLNAALHEGAWNRGRENVREMFDLKVGVLGFGWAGRHYIRLLQSFYVDIFCYDPFVDEKTMEDGGAQKSDFSWIMQNCDILSVHAPEMPSTKHMINRDTLALMKKDAVLINTARGSLIDEDALYKHMASGNLKYACLDVFDPEPPQKNHPLFTLDNVIATPHIAGLAQNGLKRIGAFICEETQNFLKALPMRGEVTEDALSKMA